MQRAQNMAMQTSQGRHLQQGEYANEFDTHARRMAQQTKAKGGKNTREKVMWVLLGFLFLKFSVLLALLFIFYSKLDQQVSQIRDGPCENEWLKFEKQCYFFSSFQLTWKKAENMCLNRGSHLVIITSQKEQDFLESNRNGKVFWIGLTDEETEGTFKWVDGTTLTDASFSYWNYGEPNNGVNKNEHCGQLWFPGKWNDDPCNETNFAICEKPF